MLASASSKNTQGTPKQCVVQGNTTVRSLATIDTPANAITVFVGKEGVRHEQLHLKKVLTHLPRKLQKNIYYHL